MSDVSLAQEFLLIAQSLPLMVEAYDSRGNLIFWNQAAESVSGYAAAELLNNPQVLNILYPGYKKNRALTHWFSTPGHNLAGRVWKMICKGGEQRDITWFNISHAAIVPTWHTWSIGWDVTDRLQLESEIKKQQKELDKQLQRTTEGRVALKVLLSQLEWEIGRARHEVSHQLSRSVNPFLDKLSQTKLDGRQRELLNLALRNLKNIQDDNSSAAENILDALTPVENEVALFIREGKTTVEIASLMSISEATVASHRHAIRRKLGLVGRQNNLQLALKKLFAAKPKKRVHLEQEKEV